MRELQRNLPLAGQQHVYVQPQIDDRSASIAASVRWLPEGTISRSDSVSFHTRGTRGTVAPRKHRTSGVFLTTRPRMQVFGLRDDAWEDGCQRLLEFGLIRHAEPPEGLKAALDAIADPLITALFSQPTRVRQS
ncbi:hypothetical protein [Streptomyces lavendulocolor]|uniref:hypothetical protein n=1 Tax=Streptomyces lavendulocolor TaxID=67316 RepID=UPI003C2FB1C5